MFLVALGANLPSSAGPPRATLEAALDRLSAGPVTVTGRSPWYRTPAFPQGSGPDFVNGAAMLGTPLAAAEVLDLLHAIERALGRRRDRRWEPRVCDLDLLAWDDRVLPDEATAREWTDLPPDERQERAPPGLVLPHPRMQERAFVLRPLADIAPDWRHPLIGRTVAEMLAALPPEALGGIARLP
jgi:2-amino-4-hydroxy-6-hydroxymethyldihydropteridine diphosphokinase